MNLHKLLLTENDCYKAGKTITPKGIMVHSTGANNPMLRRYVGPDDGLLGRNAYNNHWNVSDLSVCVHAFIGLLNDGSVATYQTLPWNHRGWHAGAAANNTHISFEICEDGLKDSVYFGKVYQEAVELTAMLCKEYNLDPMADGVVICHSEGCARGIASNHGDVMHWFPKHGKSMDTFRADVNALVKGEEEPVLPEDEPTVQEYKPTVKEWQDAAIADGFKFPKFGADGIWGDECASVAMKAVCQRRDVYMYPNLTKIVQRIVGVEADGLYGPDTEAAVSLWMWKQILGVA